MAKDNRSDLELVLGNCEPEEKIRETVLGIFDALVDIKDDYFAGGFKKPDGMIIYTNYNKGKYSLNDYPPLKIESWAAGMFQVEGNYSVHRPEGRKFLESLLYHNGAVEVEPFSGNVVDYQRKISVNADIAGLSATTVGFDEEVRKRIAGEQYRGIGTRHWTGLLATKVDPDLYILILSRQSGIINAFHIGKILYSSLPSEINPVFKEKDHPLLHKAYQLRLKFD